VRLRTGGRKARSTWAIAGTIFVFGFTYPNDVTVDSVRVVRRGFDDLCIRLYGSLGTVDSHYGGGSRSEAARTAGGARRTRSTNRAVNNNQGLLASIADGKPIGNRGKRESRMLLGGWPPMRTHGHVDEMNRREPRADPKLDLPKDGPKPARGGQVLILKVYRRWINGVVQTITQPPT